MMVQSPLSPRLVRRWGRHGAPLIIAHRGAHHATLVENTLPAFLAARDQKAHGIELDVQLCKTGEPVVFHDPDLARLAGRAAYIGDLALAELRQIELFNQGRISTLDEVLGALPDLLINIEL